MLVKMDYKYLSVILAIILILVVAFIVVRDVFVKKEEKKTPAATGENLTTTGTGIGGVFEEPPSDFEPPSLPH